MKRYLPFLLILLYPLKVVYTQEIRVPVEPGETWLNNQHQPEKLMDALKYLEHRCQSNNMTNVTTFLGKVDNPILPEGKADVAFMVSTYHHLEKPVEMMRNTIPCLKKDGILVIVERDPVKTGQTGSESTSQEKLKNDAQKAGFEIANVNTELLERDNIYFLRPK